MDEIYKPSVDDPKNLLYDSIYIHCESKSYYLGMHM